MHDGRVTGTVTDEAPRLACFGHDNIAAAQAFIQGEKLYCVIRLTGYHGKNGQVAAANRAKQRITRRWHHFACLQQARNHNSRHYQQSDPSNHHRQPHNWPPSSKDTSADTNAPAYARSFTRSSACASACAVAPARPSPSKMERAGELIRESSRRVFLCSLTEERTISSSLRLKNC